MTLPIPVECDLLFPRSQIHKCRAIFIHACCHFDASKFCDCVGSELSSLVLTLQAFVLLDRILVRLD